MHFLVRIEGTMATDCCWIVEADTAREALDQMTTSSYGSPGTYEVFKLVNPKTFVVKERLEFVVQEVT